MPELAACPSYRSPTACAKPVSKKKPLLRKSTATKLKPTKTARKLTAKPKKVETKKVVFKKKVSSIVLGRKYFFLLDYQKRVWI